MLKRYLKKSAYILLILLVLYAFARVTDKSLGGIYDGPRSPYLQMPTSQSVIIRWQTSKPNIGVVRIGQNINQLEHVFYEAQADDEHAVKLSGLKPNTKYYYRLGTRNYSIYGGEGYWFKTLPLPVKAGIESTPIRFWVTGDPGQQGHMQNKVRDAMLAWTKQNPLAKESAFTSHLDFWLTTGDNAYRSGTNQQFQDNFFTPYASILKHTPVWPAYGNHDARRWVFFNIFDFPTQAEVGGSASATEKYYSFDYADLHVVMLDSHSSRVQKNSKMLRWLKKDLSSTKQKWLVVAFHHPPYTKGSHNSDSLTDSFGRMRNMREHVLPILEKAGVDMVLAGHSHMYERSWFMNCHYGASSSFTPAYIQDRLPNSDLTLKSTQQEQQGVLYRKKQRALSAYSGTVYVTLGSSSKVDQGDLNHPAMPISLAEGGSMIVDIMANKLTAKFINEAGIVRDSFSIVKGVADAPVARAHCL